MNRMVSEVDGLGTGVERYRIVGGVGIDMSVWGLEFWWIDIRSSLVEIRGIFVRIV